MVRLGDQLDWLDTQQGRMFALLKDWAGINSYSLNVPGLALMAGAISEEVTRLGWRAVKQDLPPYQTVDDQGKTGTQALGQALRFSSPARAGRSAFLVIHYDTVFAPDHPFQNPREEGPNTLVGPGVLDAKSGVLILLYGLAAFEKSGLAERLGWEVMLNPDEELGSPGSASVMVQAAKEHDYGLVFEPALAPGVLAGMRKGSQNYTLVVRGQAAHAGRDFAKGRNAGVHMAQIVTRLHGINGLVPGVTLNVGPMHVQTPVNIVPGVAMARINVRFDSDVEMKRVEKEIGEIFQWAGLAPGFKVEIYAQAGCPAKPLTAEAVGLFELVKNAGAELGQSLEWQATGGVCDGNRLAGAGLATIDTLGGVGAGLHTESEYVEIDSLSARAKLLLMTLGALAQESEKGNGIRDK
jgi:glutamate carboxypeptidase